MFRKTVVYDACINPSWLVVGACTVLDKGVAVPFVVTVATVFTKPGVE